MKKERYIVLCILVVLFILAIIVLFEKYVISANLQEGATNNFSSYFIPSEEITKETSDGAKVYASTVFLTKNPSQKPNVNIFPDYTYYLVINPADVPGMESTLNYLTLTDLPKIKFVPYAGMEVAGSYQLEIKGYDAKNNNSWETTTQEFAIPFVLDGSSDSSWLKGTHGGYNVEWVPNAYGLQLKYGRVDHILYMPTFVDGVSFGNLILYKSKDDKIIQNPFLYDEWVTTDNTNIEFLHGEVLDGVNDIYYTNVAQDDMLKKNLSSTDSGSTGLFVGYIDKLSYISKTDMQNADVSNEIKPTILNKKIPVYLVKGDFNPYKPKSVSYFDTSSYCGNKKIYIAATSTQISKTQEDEESCAKKCEDNENCDMYLMQNENTCYTYKDVSGISMFCNKGNGHMYWGKFKSSIDMRDIARYPESTAEQKAQQEQALAQQESRKAQQEQALAQQESGEEAKYTSEKAKYTSEKAGYTSEEAKYTSEKAGYTSEEAKYTSEKAKLTSEEAKLTSEEAKLTSEEAKLTSEEERPDYSPAPSGSGGFGPIPSNAPKEPIPYCKSPTLPNVNKIYVHYSNTNASL